jgi:hypothetical protein
MATVNAAQGNASAAGTDFKVAGGFAFAAALVSSLLIASYSHKVLIFSLSVRILDRSQPLDGVSWILSRYPSH